MCFPISAEAVCMVVKSTSSGVNYHLLVIDSEQVTLASLSFLIL